MSQSIDRFRASENGILIATDLVARGIDIKNVRTIIHYKLPHSAEVYVHRCGRTARALFYWFMLKSEYTLFKYISISKLLKEKPKEYGLSYMYTEKDDNDLTYFIYFQLEIIEMAVNELVYYLDHKVHEFKKISESLEKTEWGSKLNFIQKDLIKKAVKEPGRIFTAKEISKSYSISDNTSRSYLNKLAKMKLFLSTKDGKKTIYIAPSDLLAKLNVNNAK